MNMGRLALSCIALAALVACDSDSGTDEEILANGGYVLEYELNGETYEVRRENAGRLDISCQTGAVCDENSDYRAHLFSDDNISVYMSFSPDLVGQYSYNNIVNNFNYADLRIEVPMLGSETTEVFFQPEDVLRELDFNADIGRTSIFRLNLISFDEGYLRGTWTGIITELTERRVGSADTGQGEPISVNMPFILQFNLEVER